MVLIGISDSKSKELRLLSLRLNVFGIAETTSFQSSQTVKIEKSLFQSTEIIKKNKYSKRSFSGYRSRKILCEFRNFFFLYNPPGTETLRQAALRASKRNGFRQARL